jgi:hypothetical protein
VFGQLESDDPTIIRVIDVVIDEGKATYVRGLAARTLSAVCLRVKDAKAKLLRSEKWGPLMDALLDVIGLCNQPKTRAQLTEVDRDRVRRNCCVALSILMDQSPPAAAAQVSKVPPSAVPRQKGQQPAAAKDAANPVSADDELYAQWSAARMETQPSRVINKPGKAEGTGSSPSRRSGGSSRDAPRGGGSSSSKTPMKDLIRHVKTVTPHVAPPQAETRARRKRPSARPRRDADRPPPPPPPHGPGSISEVSSITQPLDLLSVSQLSSASAFSSVQLSGPLMDPRGHRGDLQGYFYKDGKVQTQVKWRTHMPGPRPAVLFGDKAPVDESWVPNGDDQDLFEKDRKLGYQVSTCNRAYPSNSVPHVTDGCCWGSQVPRVWFPAPVVEGDARLVGVPEGRKSPLALAKRPFTSTKLVEEYNRVLALQDYRAIHELSERDPSFRDAFDPQTWRRMVDTFKRNADVHNFDAQWTPRRGNAQQRFQWRKDRSPPRPTEPPAPPAAAPREPSKGRKPPPLKLRPKPDTTVPPPKLLEEPRMLIRAATRQRPPAPERKEQRVAEEAKAQAKRRRLQSILTADDVAAAKGAWNVALKSECEDMLGC